MSYRRHINRQKAQNQKQFIIRTINKISELGDRFLAVIVNNKYYTVFRQTDLFKNEYTVDSYWGKITPFISKYFGFSWEDIIELKTGQTRSANVEIEVFTTARNAEVFCKNMT
jgi:hypothetical protein